MVPKVQGVDVQSRRAGLRLIVGSSSLWTAAHARGSPNTQEAVRKRIKKCESLDCVWDSGRICAFRLLFAKFCPSRITLVLLIVEEGISVWISHNMARLASWRVVNPVGGVNVGYSMGFLLPDLNPDSVSLFVAPSRFHEVA